MAAFIDACRFIPTAGGTTDWTYSSAVGGYQSPSAAGAANGTKYKYRAESADLTQWEIGEGTYNTSTGVLTRTTVLYNSSATGSASGQSGAGTKISFSATPQVAIVAAAEDLPNADAEIGRIEWWPTSDLPANRLRADGASYTRSAYVALAAVLVKSGTATFTNGSANVGMTAHGRSLNDPIKLFTSGSLPTNFTAGTHGLVTVGTVYYVKSIVDTNTVTLSATPGGAAVTAGSAGSGTQTWVCAPHGDGDGSTNFTVPDYRGGFIRALDNGAGVDANRSVGSLQIDAMQGHIHAFSQSSSNVYERGSGGVGGYGAGTTLDRVVDTVGNPTSDGTNGTPRTAAETRPRNVAALVTIRYA